MTVGDNVGVQPQQSIWTTYYKHVGLRHTQVHVAANPKGPRMTVMALLELERNDYGFIKEAVLATAPNQFKRAGPIFFSLLKEQGESFQEYTNKLHYIPQADTLSQCQVY